MGVLLRDGNIYRMVEFSNEAEFERAVVSVSKELFGQSMVYLDLKKKIGAKRGLTAGIPDGFLLDFSSPSSPRLHVVENELASHDLVRHVGVQLFNFAAAFKKSRQQLKEQIVTFIEKTPTAKTATHNLYSRGGFPNLDRAIDFMLFKSDYSSIVVIDETGPELDDVLSELAKKPAVLQLQRYALGGDGYIYSFVPFQQDDGAIVDSKADEREMDTVVVPAQEEGFQRVFIGENRWYSIRMAPKRMPMIKHIAAYRTAPLSAITHLAHVREIRPFENTGKFELLFDGPAEEIKHIPAGGAKGFAPQGPCYTSLQRLKVVRTFGELMK
jgi:hypothetical protein